jgi:protease IV
MRFARIVLAVTVAALAPIGAGCVVLDLDLGNIGQMQEVTLVPGESDEKILLVRIDGEITDRPMSTGFFGSQEGSTAQVKEALELALEDRSVKAILLRIDSPGGGVTASDIIYREILDWKKKTKKPVVALFMDMAASGGYYVAQAADRIVAHPTCITGSIGVIAMFPNFTGLGDKLGVKVHTIKSGDNKDVGNPFRAMSDDDRKQLQTLIDQIYTQFFDVVLKGRPGLTPDRLKKVADGRVLTAKEAKAAGLIDEIGYFPEAIAAAKSLAKLTDPRVVAYEQKSFGSGRRTIYSGTFVDPKLAGAPAPGREGDTNLLKIDARELAPGGRPGPAFKYLWMPTFNN